MDNAWGISWEATDVLSADTTDALSADTTNVLLADTTDVLSADAFPSENPPAWIARFGTSKIESGHHLDILGDLPAISVGVVLTR